jgi:uncharacterized membrane protein YGL010W
MATKTAAQWFDEYGASHQNGVNKFIHWICVPLIAACVIAFFWEIPTPAWMQAIPYLNWATLLLACAMVFYVRLSVPLAIGMLLFGAVVIGAIAVLERTSAFPVWQWALIVFVLAWIGQFIGHRIEGKKPSFFQDLQFLLIGPVWLLGFIYQKLRIPY